MLEILGFLDYMEIFYCSEIEHLVGVIKVILYKKSHADNQEYQHEEDKLCRIGS